MPECRNSPKLVSVIIPCFNASAVLGDQLNALSHQTYDGRWEVVIVDNRSTDSSANVAMNWADKLPSLRIVPAMSRSGVCHARNEGIAAAAGDLIAICDADDVVSPRWLESIVKSSLQADLVGGSFENAEDGPDEMAALHVHSSLGVAYASGANLGVWKEVHDSIGGFNEDYVGGADDVEYSVRAMLNGFHLAFARGAAVYHRPRSDPRGTARQWFNYRKGDARLYAEYRKHGVKWRSPRTALASWLKIVLLAPSMLWAGPEQRRNWAGLVGGNLGRLVGSVEYRILAL